jgi:ketosteroid isomerase-like protein
MSMQSVIEHHLQALADGDLEANMADYADECVFIGNGRIFEGKEAVRQVFAGALANGPFRVSLKDALYHGNTGFITWEVPGVITLGTDTFVVENDRIVVQTNAVVMAG